MSKALFFITVVITQIAFYQMAHAEQKISAVLCHPMDGDAWCADYRTGGRVAEITLYSKGEVDALVQKNQEIVYGLLYSQRQTIDDQAAQIDRQSKLINSLYVAILKQIGNIPHAVAADDAAIALLKERLEAEFDKRYLMR